MFSFGDDKTNRAEFIKTVMNYRPSWICDLCCSSCLRCCTSSCSINSSFSSSTSLHCSCSVFLHRQTHLSEQQTTNRKSCHKFPKKTWYHWGEAVL